VCVVCEGVGPPWSFWLFLTASLPRVGGIVATDLWLRVCGCAYVGQLVVSDLTAAVAFGAASGGPGAMDLSTLDVEHLSAAIRKAEAMKGRST
jgi:hypothetical protein